MRTELQSRHREQQSHKPLLATRSKFHQSATGQRSSSNIEARLWKCAASTCARTVFAIAVMLKFVTQTAVFLQTDIALTEEQLQKEEWMKRSHTKKVSVDYLSREQEVQVVNQLRDGSSQRKVTKMKPSGAEDRYADEEEITTKREEESFKRKEESFEGRMQRRKNTQENNAKNEELTDESISDNKDEYSKPCALLFFGLARQFATVSLPSIQKNILHYNNNCSVFVHTYNASHAVGGRENEDGKSIINVEEVMLLQDSTSKLQTIIFETDEEFQKQHDLSYFRKLFPKPSYWSYPTSMDNMIRQWHSISKVWDSMVSYEEAQNYRFRTVGMFRLDLQYIDPIPIANEIAVIPAMTYEVQNWGGINDRHFHGSRDYAAIWATKRFETVDTYIQNQWNHAPSSANNPLQRLTGLHSENFLEYLMSQQFQIPFVEKDMCLPRVRSNGKVLDSDCELLNKNKEYRIKSDITPGVIILGMHRSGTSMLSGMISSALSLNVPGRLTVAKHHPEQNPQGFFENFDIVRQDDEWMLAQNKTWFGLGMITDGLHSDIVKGQFKSAGIVSLNGREALTAFNNITNVPWVLKDPRLCITLPRWRPLLHGASPPVLFTYRNPYDVALSLYRRKVNNLPLLEGFELWIWYNREAIRNSANMCRAITSNNAILSQPEKEIKRIASDLFKCGLKYVDIDIDAVKESVHVELQHGKSPTNNSMCTLLPGDTTRSAKMVTAACKKSFQVYHDMENGNAFKADYRWPILNETYEAPNVIKTVGGTDLETKTINSEGFASCLLVNDPDEISIDDQDSKLQEWLAYHGLTLPLKYLIVAVDSSQKDQTESILQRWNSSNTGMEILLWNVKDYETRSLTKTHFYRQCMGYHKDMGRTWVALINSDEYVTFNHYADDEGEKLGKIDLQPTTPKQYVNKAYMGVMEEKRKTLPSNITIFTFINDQFDSDPCFLVSRLFFSSVEPTKLDKFARNRILNQTVVSSFAKTSLSLDQFRTMRYFHHQEKNGWEYNLRGRMLVDVSRIDSLVGKEVCSISLMPYRASSLRVNAYLGPRELYSTTKGVDKVASIDKGIPSYDTLPWLNRFIEKVGVEKSISLLSGAGKDVSNTATKTKLKQIISNTTTKTKLKQIILNPATKTHTKIRQQK